MALIRAAGGVVVREGRVLIVHRPRYDDWSLPKGKLKRGEDWGAGALREVLEETGLECSLGEQLDVSTYTVQGDIYGLGATMYEALTGQPPGGGLVGRMEGRKIPTPVALNPKVPGPLNGEATRHVPSAAIVGCTCRKPDRSRRTTMRCILLSCCVSNAVTV